MSTGLGMSAPESIWRGTRGGITVGAVALIFFAALEALAMTTVRFPGVFLLAAGLTLVSLIPAMRLEQPHLG